MSKKPRKKTRHFYEISSCSSGVRSGKALEQSLFLAVSTHAWNQQYNQLSLRFFRLSPAFCFDILLSPYRFSLINFSLSFSPPFLQQSQDIYNFQDSLSTHKKQQQKNRKKCSLLSTTYPSNSNKSAYYTQLIIFHQNITLFIRYI